MSMGTLFGIARVWQGRTKARLRHRGDAFLVPSMADERLPREWREEGERRARERAESRGHV